MRTYFVSGRGNLFHDSFPPCYVPAKQEKRRFYLILIEYVQYCRSQAVAGTIIQCQDKGTGLNDPESEQHSAASTIYPGHSEIEDKDSNDDYNKNGNYDIRDSGPRYTTPYRRTNYATSSRINCFSRTLGFMRSISTTLSDGKPDNSREINEKVEPPG